MYKNNKMNGLILYALLSYEQNIASFKWPNKSDILLNKKKESNAKIEQSNRKSKNKNFTKEIVICINCKEKRQICQITKSK